MLDGHLFLLLALVCLVLGDDVLGSSDILIHYKILLSENWASHFTVELGTGVASDAVHLLLNKIFDGVL